MTSEDHNKTLLELTANIVSAHVAKNQIAANALPALIEQVYNALKTAGSVPAPVAVEKQLPFVPAKRSIFPDYIVCLEDGRKLKTLKRHLRSTFGLSPEQYREKWGLAPDYPMVAPNYAQHRSKLAKQLGLGRKPSADEEDDEPETVAVAAPQPAAIVPEVAHVKRRAEPTAASVFAKFPAKQPEAAAPSEEVSEPPARQKRSRKPFSKQLARSMRQ